MAEGSRQVPITILGKEYMVVCGPDEETALLQSAGLLDRRMREIRDGGKVIGTERIAVMAALNIAHELLQGGAVPGVDEDVRERMRNLAERIESVLDEEDPQLKF